MTRKNYLLLRSFRRAHDRLRRRLAHAESHEHRHRRRHFTRSRVFTQAQVARVHHVEAACLRGPGYKATRRVRLLEEEHHTGALEDALHRASVARHIGRRCVVHHYELRTAVAPRRQTTRWSMT